MSEPTTNEDQSRGYDVANAHQNGTATKTGLKIDRVFSDPDVHPFDQVEWTTRTAEIKDETGKHVFKQDGVEFPATWSQLAVNVVASKYFYGDNSAGNGSPTDGKREYSVRQLIRRVGNTIAAWGFEDGYFDTMGDANAFQDELEWLLVNQHGAFNSPVWFNVGLWDRYGVEGSYDGYRYDEAQFRAVPVVEGEAYKHPQGSACFIVGVGDSIPEIYERAAIEGRIFKYGSGCGSNNSSIRSSREVVRGGGTPSGPLSFMSVYDSVAKVTKSGGRCLAGDQLVFTETGPRTAEELAGSGDFITLAYSKRAGRNVAKVARVWRQHRKQVVELTTDKGKFRLTPDHHLMLRTGEAIQVGELKPGMRLLPLVVDVREGYARVHLRNGRKGKMHLHRLIASDVMRLETDGLHVHHANGNKFDNRISNIEVLTPADHATHHGRELALANEHVFQRERFPKYGSSNPMSAGSKFWSDAERSSAYRGKQGAILKESGRAKGMQGLSNAPRMLNMGYRLINRGYDISTFQKYINARNAECGIGNSKATQMARFVKHFGGYEEFYKALGVDNHKVLSVENIGEQVVYTIEVDDTEPDDKRDWSEHNYTILPVGTEGFAAHGLVSLNSRRAAKMEILDDWHPDILEFIRCKGVEEAKAHALIREGYESNFNGEAYSTVCFQNSNMSVRCSDDFMCKVDSATGDKSWQTRAVTTGTSFNTRGDQMPAYNADDIFNEVAKGTWKCGDPGVHFTDTIQKWHTCKASEPIHACNPCSEFLFIDNTACNLASLNLLKFVDETGWFDFKRFRAACSIFFIAQEILVGRSGYPTEKICENSHDFRPLGLGYCNLGALLMNAGLPYDSDEGRSYAAAITAIMHGQANLTSVELAKVKGPFAAYAKNRDCFLEVMEMHRDRVSEIDPGYGYVCSLKEEAEEVWFEVLSEGRVHGFRNAQATLLAPTGTIGLAMDAATTGVEPDISLVKYKVLAGGGNLRYVNTVVPSALKNLGYDESAVEQIVDFVNDNDTIEGAPHLKPEHFQVFDCAFPSRNGGRCIAWKGHMDMMAAVQPFLAGAISKTCNVPEHFSVNDIRDAYIYAWKQGLKCVAIYRDNSKGSQPLSTKAESKKDDPTAIVPVTPRRERLPVTRRSLTHKFTIGGHEGYVNVGFYPDGRPGEIFVTISKEGSTISGLMDAWATAISLGLQYGMPLQVLVDKFAFSQFEPSGSTRNPDVPFAKSLTDYVSRWLGSQFLEGYRDANSPSREYDGAAPIVITPKAIASQQEQFAKFQADAPLCDTCGSVTVRNGTCYRCFTCGSSLGCS